MDTEGLCPKVTTLTKCWQVMAAPLKISSKMSRVEDTVRRYDSVIPPPQKLLLLKSAQVCLHGRVVTCLVLTLVSGAYLTASSSLATISASTSCELPPQLVLPLANPMMVILLASSVLNLTVVQHTANDLQHEFVITRTQKVNSFPI